MPNVAPDPVKGSIESRVDSLFVNGEKIFLESPELRAYGLILLILMSDWKAWVARRVETVTFEDPDTVRRKMSIDFAPPKLPVVCTLEGKPLHFLPLTLLRKRRLTNFDLQDENGRSLPLLTHRASSSLAAAMLGEAAYAFTSDGQSAEGSADPGLTRPDSLPIGSLSSELWRMVHLPAAEASDIWRCFAQRDRTEPRLERRWRWALADSWRFLSLANDLTRNFIVFTPMTVENDERRIVKLTHTEHIRLPAAGFPLMRKIERQLTRPLPTRLPVRADGPRRRFTVEVRSNLEDGEMEPLPGVHFELTDDRGTCCGRRRTSSDGCRSDQYETGTYTLAVKTPPGLMLTSPGERSQLEIDRDLTGEHAMKLVFRRGPEDGELPVARLSLGARIRRLAAIDPKTIEITAPAIGQARSYHLEYIVAEGMFVSSAALDVVSSVRQRGQASPRIEPDLHVTTAHRVHLHHRYIDQDSMGIAEIALRARTSTIVRGATGVSFLSLAMVALLRWRWENLGASSIGTEVALLLAVPGGLSAYVARSPSDSFTGIVLMGLRGLALSSIIWCFAAAAVIATSRAIKVAPNGPTAGPPFAWSNIALDVIMALNAITFTVLLLAWKRSWRPPEAKQ
ncbi:MAG TPA: hypothetical protein VK701_01850 [Solirubrobacteraceae bacterium]|nr:hypothetical protein [Solirubrobacteraceae bacterium]